MISSLPNEYPSCFLNYYDFCLLIASVVLWNCGTVETGAGSLMTHMINDLQCPNGYESCILNASVGLWDCGTVDTGL